MTIDVSMQGAGLLDVRRSDETDVTTDCVPSLLACEAICPRTNFLMTLHFCLQIFVSLHYCHLTTRNIESFSV